MGDLDDTVASLSGTSLLGFILADIVGIQHCGDNPISAGERFAVVREPSNVKDANAILVLNTRGVRVGYINATAARVLAPLIDSQLISVEVIVPRVPRVRKLVFVESQIHVVARVDDFEHVKSAILRGNLMLIPPAGKEVRSVDENFTLVGRDVRKKAKPEALEPPAEIIMTHLLEHQKQGLGWLVHTENTGELPPFWEERRHVYVNVLTNHCPVERPEPLRGGIFADQSGLGKTLTLLSLIALDKFDVSMASVQSDSAKRKGKMGISQSPKKSKTGHSSSSSVTLDDETWDGTKSTLVVCPPSALSTWTTQVSQHTRNMKLYRYHGRRTKDAEELREHDIVLTTYAILANEEPLEESPVKKIEWWRVILDEAHVIKNVNAQQSRAVTNLKARRRWAVTGTPLQNGSFDLFSLMAFLRFEPFSIKSYWQSLIQRPLSQRNQTGLSRLQVLMATLSLRRTKDEVLIGLPQKTIETCYIELSSEERGLYDRMEQEVKSAVEEYIDAGSVMRNYTAVLGIILRLRQICSSMALCPPEVTSLLPSNKIEDVSNNPELLKKLVAVLQDGEDIDCPICISPCTNLIITRCAHIYCQGCIIRTLQNPNRQCPLCRSPLAESDLFSAPPESSDSSKVENLPCAKISTLLNLLLAAKDRNRSAKSVVYSEFRKMLLLLEGPLREAGFHILRLDCSMSANRRQEVIEEFGAPEQGPPTTLLASLKAAGAAINLSAASTVYLFEPWWNPAVEEQAVDRVHRIGQKEDVKIVRLIASNSIEERILKLQERKKTLARKAFGKWASTDGREIGLDDLRALVSL
ncbi:hypothetical protein NL676_022219 [Syzygium grande]|nr:hypothetical protein NL676_022219 [Syzygium grande]